MDLARSIEYTHSMFKNKHILTRREKWQGIDVSDKPEFVTHELQHYTFTASLRGRSLLYYQEQIKPDLPWADDHFVERIGGEPLNPPPSEQWWPHAPQGNSQFKEGGVFSHTYPERFWPKKANGGLINGIRYAVGDFGDFVNLLQREPYTRQAYFPIWFPEDTGNIAGVRTPCTLGYHILLTNDDVDITYYIRSCDLLRHFRNDLYFTVRFLMHVLDSLRTQPWTTVRPRTLRAHIANLHCFRNDYYKLFPSTP